MAQPSTNCPRCSKPLTYVQQYGKWYCHSCQTYPFDPAATATNPAAKCPTCASQLTYVAEYKAWYCYTCRKYAAVADPKHSLARCPTCQGQLTYSQERRDWYCYKCKRYLGQGQFSGAPAAAAPGPKVEAPAVAPASESAAPVTEPAAATASETPAPAAAARTEEASGTVQVVVVNAPAAVASSFPQASEREATPIEGESVERVDSQGSSPPGSPAVIVPMSGEGRETVAPVSAAGPDLPMRVEEREAAEPAAPSPVPQPAPAVEPEVAEVVAMPATGSPPPVPEETPAPATPLESPPESAPASHPVAADSPPAGIPSASAPVTELQTPAPTSAAESTTSPARPVRAERHATESTSIEKTFFEDLRKSRIERKVERKDEGAERGPRKETIIEDVFLMYNDGRLIRHFTRRLKPTVDSEMLSSMIVAVSAFVKDSFGQEDEGAATLDEIKYGPMRIHLARGKYLTVAMLIQGDDVEGMVTRARQRIREVETLQEPAVKDWDGRVSSMQPVHKHFEALFG